MSFWEDREGILDEITDFCRDDFVEELGGGERVVGEGDGRGGEVFGREIETERGSPEGVKRREESISKDFGAGGGEIGKEEGGEEAVEEGVTEEGGEERGWVESHYWGGGGEGGGGRGEGRGEERGVENEEECVGWASLEKKKANEATSAQNFTRHSLLISFSLSLSLSLSLFFLFLPFLFKKGYVY